MEQAQRIMGLLMRYMNHVAATLIDAPEDFEPLLMENPNEGHPLPVIDEWCTGYMKGISLDAAGWLPVTVGHPDWLSTIILYGTEEGWEQLKRKNFAEDEHWQRAAGLGDTDQEDPCALLGAAQERRGQGRYDRGTASPHPQPGKGRTQRSVPLRLGQEVQAVPWELDLVALRYRPDDTEPLVVSALASTMCAPAT